MANHVEVRYTKFEDMVKGDRTPSFYGCRVFNLNGTMSYIGGYNTFEDLEMFITNQNVMDIIRDFPDFYNQVLEDGYVIFNNTKLTISRNSEDSIEVDTTDVYMDEVNELRGAKFDIELLDLGVPDDIMDVDIHS